MGTQGNYLYRPSYGAIGQTEYDKFDTGLVSADSVLTSGASHLTFSDKHAINTVAATSVTATSVSATNVKATTITGTTFSGTDVKVTSVTATNISATNISATTLTATTISASTGLYSSNITGSSFNLSANDSSTTAIVRGPTMAIRMGTYVSGGLIEGVDDTGVSSYEHLNVGGGSLSLTISGTEKLGINSNGIVGTGVVSATSLSATSLCSTNLTSTYGDIVGVNASGVAALVLRNGDNGTPQSSASEIRFGWNNTDSYQHFIATRHSGGASAGNAIEFYTGDGTQNGVFSANAILGLSVENRDIYVPGIVSATNIKATTITGTTVCGTTVSAQDVKAATATATTFSGTNVKATEVTATTVCATNVYGTLQVKIDDLLSGDDNTDLNATTSAHGLLPKLGAGSSKFLREDGTWVAPSGGGDVLANGTVPFTAPFSGSSAVFTAGTVGVVALTATNISATYLSGTTVSATTFSGTDAKVTSVTATNISATSVSATTMTATTFSGTNVKATEVTATTVCATNLYGYLTTIDSAALTASQVQTVAHSLGARPSFVQVSLLCITADVGYSVGDEVFANPNYFDGTYNSMWTVAADATNFVCITTTSMPVVNNKGTGAPVAVTAGDWKFRMRFSK